MRTIIIEGNHIDLSKVEAVSDIFVCSHQVEKHGITYTDYGFGFQITLSGKEVEISKLSKNFDSAQDCLKCITDRREFLIHEWNETKNQKRWYHRFFPKNKDL